MKTVIEIKPKVLADPKEYSFAEITARPGFYGVAPGVSRPTILVLRDGTALYIGLDYLEEAQSSWAHTTFYEFNHPVSITVSNES
jgi:hypothetical protein